jgi:hypothetical protein
MKVQQLSVFLENKSGRLAEIANVLSQGCINIRAVSLADTTDFGIVRLIVDDVDKSADILKENGITAVKTDVIVIEASDKPGGLASILNIIKDTDLNVEYLYSITAHHAKAFIVFRFDNPDKAVALCQSKGVKVVTKEELQPYVSE